MCENCPDNEDPKYIPVNTSHGINWTDTATRSTMKEASSKYREFLEILGFDLNDPNMSGTPERVAKMFMKEIFSGCFTEPPPITLFDLSKSSSGSTDEFICVGPIPVKSMCSHHMMPIVGSAYIGILLVKGKKIYPGLSKYHRIVDYYARRPQIQEQLTQQIHDHISDIVGLKDVAKEDTTGGVIVVIKADHFCVSHRGVGADMSTMTTSSISGMFHMSSVKDEFFKLSGI